MLADDPHQQSKNAEYSGHLYDKCNPPQSLPGIWIRQLTFLSDGSRYIADSSQQRGNKSYNNRQMSKLARKQMLTNIMRIQCKRFKLLTGMRIAA